MLQAAPSTRSSAAPAPYAWEVTQTFPAEHTLGPERSCLILVTCPSVDRRRKGAVSPGHRAAHLPSSQLLAGVASLKWQWQRGHGARGKQRQIRLHMWALKAAWLQFPSPQKLIWSDANETFNISLQPKEREGFLMPD